MKFAKIPAPKKTLFNNEQGQLLYIHYLQSAKNLKQHSNEDSQRKKYTQNNQ